MSHDTPLADAAARAQALSPEGSFIVQAPAGSGKTGLITQRFLALLARVGEPEEIIAITFTRKAAAEMRARILEALAQAERGEVGKKGHEQTTLHLARQALRQDRLRRWELMDNPGRLAIQTVDSLCNTLTRRMPMLSGMGGSLGIVERAMPLYQEAARATLDLLERGGEWGEAVERLLLHLDGYRERVEEMLAHMLARRDQWLRHVMRAGKEEGDALRAYLEEALRAEVAAGVGRAEAAFPKEYRRECLSMLLYAAYHIPEDKPRPLSCGRDLPAFPGARGEDLPAWLALADLLLTAGGAWRRIVNIATGFPPKTQGQDREERATYQGMKDRFMALLEDLGSEEEARSTLYALRALPPVTFAEGQWQLLAALLRLLPAAVAQLHVLFAARGETDFMEIALGAEKSLGEPEAPTELALQLDHGIRHLLVDEFQDTSQSQFRLLERLVAGWTPGDGRTLFLVGDPMQSIYRFREAEVGLFLRAAQQGVGSVALSPLHLSVNFRSQAGVVSWINETFSQVFPSQEDMDCGAVTYLPSVPFHREEPGPAVVVHPFLGHDTRDAEAHAVVAAAREARSRGESVAILVRARSHLSHILPALRQGGLSCRAVDIEPLGARPLIRDLLALTLALSHPGDRLSWLTVLRAPWCGLGRADLLQVAAAESIPRALLDTAPLPGLSADGAARTARLGAVLRQAWERNRRLGARDWVEGAWLALGGPGGLAGEADLADAGAFFTLLENLEAGEGVVQRQRLLEEVGALNAAADPDGVVQVMTIHKAKGLEFDCVILPGLGRGAPPNRGDLLQWVERHGRLLLAPIHASGDERDPIHAFISGLNGQKEDHERVRTLYVAATRAKKRLHLLGTVGWSEGQESLAPRAKTPLALLWAALSPFFPLSPPERGGAAPEPLPKVDVLRRLAGDVILPPPPRDCRREAQEEIPPMAPIEFAWAGETLPRVGSVVHRYLCRMAREGVEQWSPARIHGQRAVMAGMLAQMGVPGREMAFAVGRVSDALVRTLQDERGRWILSRGHDQAHNEWALTGGRLGRSLVLDRSFVDEEGVRWIIDYKTSAHAGGDLEAFLDNERQRYRDQMGHYGELLAILEPGRKIRLGLYFPLLSAWRAWEHDG